ncbi:hypothetical protein C8Q74DRAFT_1200302 [Fomes fomentarius]|nr:hypothetical protein C8Q74DRAFT_1200302 [Fomes fomentarius]
MTSPALAHSPPHQHQHQLQHKHTNDNVIADPASPAARRDSPHGSQQRPPPQPKRSNFDLEPNPFEQSFARPSNDSSLRTQQKSPDSAVRSSASHSSHDDSRPPSKAHDRDDSAKPTLPPIDAINSPSDSNYAWGFSSAGLSNSLRSGPLSPAMLAGPQPNSNNDQPLPGFDPNSFRTGLTPRTGMTPGTGLTPIIGSVFPPPSPGTAAWLNLMSSNGAPSLSNVATITPNTLSAITGALPSGPGPHHNTSPTNPSPLSVSHTASYPRAENQTNNGGSYVTSAVEAASSSTNGLFLLSQAHQELTKREQQEKAAAASAQTNGNGAVAANGKRGAKRKNTYEDPHIVESPEMAAQQPASAKGPSKRTRSSTTASTSTTGRNKRGRSESFGEEEEEDEDEMGLQQSPPPPSTKKGGANHQKKPETEEEKRRNFLERNRQAALKCRQRKKAWLAQLQAKVEYLSNENERLTSALVASREEIARLSALVGAASVGQPVPLPVSGAGGSMNVNQGVGVGGGHNGAGVPGGPPVSVNVSLPPPGKNAVAMVGGGGRGYGY